MNPASAATIAASSAPASAGGRSLGGFRLGGSHYALPMHALREVVPCGSLAPLPSLAPGLVGGLTVRGAVVPVLDLRQVLGQRADPIEMPCVVIFAHRGQVLGLLAEEVTGVFEDREEYTRQLRSNSDRPLLLSHCSASPDGSTVSVLLPASIVSLPGLPMLDDPEPKRASRSDADTPGVATLGASPSFQAMFADCGRVRFALDALSVQATLSDFSIRTDTPLAVGACRGVLEYAGAKVPALDLLRVSGLGQLDANARLQAFVIRFPVGMLAFLVDKIVDIRPADPATSLPLPDFVMRSPLFGGVMDVDEADAAAPTCFVLRAEALLADPEFAALASTTQGEPKQAGASRDAAKAETISQLLTFDLEFETAAPLEHVREILPFSELTTPFPADRSLLGVLTRGGRSIPVVCLGQAMGIPVVAPGQGASVLVVESEAELVGFLVPRLKAIEASGWRPRLGRSALSMRKNTADPSGAELALIGNGRAERLIPVLDLRSLAGAIRHAMA